MLHSCLLRSWNVELAIRFFGDISCSDLRTSAGIFPIRQSCNLPKYVFISSSFRLVYSGEEPWDASIEFREHGITPYSSLDVILNGLQIFNEWDLWGRQVFVIVVALS